MTSRFTARSAPGFLVALCFSAGLLMGDGMAGVTGTGMEDATSSMPGNPGGAASSVREKVDAAPIFVLSAGLTILFTACIVRRDPAALSLFALPLITIQGCLTGVAGDREATGLSGLHLRRAVVLGTVVGPPQERPGRVRFALRSERLFVDSLWRAHPATVLATVVWGSRDSVRPQIRCGDRVALSGVVLLPSLARNPGEMAPRRWYRANGFSHDVLVRGARSVRILGEGEAPLLQTRIVEPLRRAAVESLEAGYGGQGGEFLKGLLLGIREGIDPGTQEAFVNAGVAHILAVSGSNVAVVAAIILFVLGLIRVPLRYTPVPVALVLLLYMLVTGSQPPVVRATVMALLVIGGRLVQRRVSGVNIIGVAALVVLLDSPRLLFDAGFQLSFAAVLSLVLVYPALDRRIIALRVHGVLRKPAVWMLRLAGISLVATLGTLPITALSFGRLSIVGVVANIPVVPLSGVAVVLGAASMMCRWTVPLLAPGFEAVNGLILDVTLEITRFAGGLPWASIDTSSWTVLEVVPFLAGAGALLCPARSRPRRLLALVTLAAIALIVLLARPSVLEAPSRTLTVSVIDVGQGDAILLQLPGGHSMLVDAGPRTPTFDAGGRVVTPLLKRLGVDRLTYLVLTHAHADHAGGLDAVLRSLPVDTILSSSWVDPGGRAVPSRRLVAGTCINPTPDSRIYVLWPGDVEPSLSGANNRSVVLKLVFGEFSMLLTGDAEAEVERRMVERYGAFMRSRVMKVPHHGSSSGSSAAFLRAVRPELAVISVGILNRFGHPSATVLARFGQMYCPVARTDEGGCVIVRTDGRSWKRVVWRD
jgi:competence protein ComEC